MQAYLRGAQAYRGLGQLDNAVRMLQKAVQLDPACPAAQVGSHVCNWLCLTRLQSATLFPGRQWFE